MNLFDQVILSATLKKYFLLELQPYVMFHLPEIANVYRHHIGKNNVILFQRIMHLSIKIKN